MTQIEVWTKDTVTPLIFEEVEEYWERRKQLEILQEEMYTTTLTVIPRESILRYKIIESR